MASKMFRVEIRDEREERIINLLTPAERRTVLLAAGQEKARQLSE